MSKPEFDAATELHIELVNHKDEVIWDTKVSLLDENGDLKIVNRSLMTPLKLRASVHSMTVQRRPDGTGSAGEGEYYVLPSTMLEPWL